MASIVTLFVIQRMANTSGFPKIFGVKTTN